MKNFINVHEKKSFNEKLIFAKNDEDEENFPLFFLTHDNN